ncbi:hypothetical protein ONS95_003040 [Cadophora gregata]|uniref:uncharacterized protein n=1 Tax=Cadophora gregata TaxID=51156 RepID=UPI0026DB1F21|nr:uncharacterized protein ONS95_003040 [Cadophora gregata]KAK0108220.1 hypothetical protein ONS95_003040 [Cadophora gregata]KAK0109189.1 hypothetical protein ONS96_003012 [Cadophora gregata f. sp. sojae]
MALNLGSLPNEILSKIFHRNRLSNNDMCSVARTCKHFNVVSTPLVYSNVKARRFVNDERRFSLIQTLKDNPSRANLILKLSFSWADNGTTFGEDQESIVQFLLRRTTRLRTLKMKVTAMKEYPMPIPVVSGAFLDVNPMAELWRVEVSCINITWQTMGNILLLPKISAIFFMPMDIDPSRVEGHLPQRPAGRTSKIRYLALEGHPKCVPSVHELLQWSSNLGALLYDFGEYDDSGLHAPSTLQEFLAPIVPTVFYLDLQGRHTDDFHCSLIDFHDFPKLRTLEISRSLLFFTIFEEGGKHVVEPSSRNGLYLRLPRILEELVIFFDFGSAILDRKHHSRSHNFVDEEYDWIEELATFKPDYLPNLKRVKFAEHSDPDPGSHNVRNFSVGILKSFDAIIQAAGNRAHSLCQIIFGVQKWRD